MLQELILKHIDMTKIIETVKQVALVQLAVIGAQDLDADGNADGKEVLQVGAELSDAALHLQHAGMKFAALIQAYWNKYAPKTPAPPLK